MRTAILIVTGSVLLPLWLGCQAPQPTEQPPAEDPMVSVDTLFPEPEGFLEDRIGSEDYPIPPYAKSAWTAYEPP